MKDGPRRLILCPQHKQAHLPCRWFVEVELPPGQARTALRRHCPYTPSQCQATPAAGPPNWQHRVFYSRFTHSPTHQGRGPSELEVSTGAPHTHVQYMHKHTHHKHTCTHTHKHTHAYKITHKYMYTSVQFSSVASDSLQPHGLSPARLPCPWDSPGKNTGVGSHSLLQGIFT